MIILSGGTGTPKLLPGLKEVFGEENLTIVVNTAEDVYISGNLICPDVDSVIYTLAGIIDRERWWGVAGDTFHTHNALKRRGHDERMMIGDTDRATHILRTELIKRGMTLTEATCELKARFGINAEILPMTDERVSTRIITPDGELHFQEFWVTEHGEPEVCDVRFDGIERAKPTRAVINALESAHEVLIGPSNPITSIGPILGLKGVRELLKGKEVAAISPIVGNEPVSGPAGKLMRAKGFEVSPSGIYRCYEDFLDALVIDKNDKLDVDVDLKVIKTDILIRTPEDSVRLAMLLRDHLAW